jgi:hypothetical protein
MEEITEVAEIVAPIVTTATTTKPNVMIYVASAAVGYLVGSGVVYLIKRKKDQKDNNQKIEG